MTVNCLLLALLIAALLLPIACEHSHKDQMFRASVTVTRNGLYEPGCLVTFFADKIEDGHQVVSGDQMTADKFTDFLGYADYLFGYNLDYDEDAKQFDQGVRIVAIVIDDGRLYGDTACTSVPFTSNVSEYQLEGMTIDLPPDD